MGSAAREIGAEQRLNMEYEKFLYTIPQNTGLTAGIFPVRKFSGIADKLEFIGLVYGAHSPNVVFGMRIPIILPNAKAHWIKL